MIGRLHGSGRTRRSGYTLIEMLIAVSLVAVLMTVVWGLMSMYTTLQTVGSEATAEQQLVRSVMQLIQDDLSRVPLSSSEEKARTTDPFAAFAPVLPSPESSREPAGSTATIFEIADLIRNENSGPANIAIRGTSDAIRITVPQQSSWTSPTNQSEGFVESVETATLPDGLAPSVEEFQTIVVQIQHQHESELTALPTGLLRTQANAAQVDSVLSRQANPDGESMPQGLRLSKTVIEELLFPPADDRQTSEADNHTQATCDLIPDVVGLEFRYHDGNNWQRSWSSSRASQLPAAIEVTIDVITARQLMDLETLSQTSEQPDRLEHYLKQAFTRSEPERRRQPPADTPLESLTITPHRYTSIILLDTTKEVRSQPQTFDSGEFER